MKKIYIICLIFLIGIFVLDFNVVYSTEIILENMSREEIFKDSLGKIYSIKKGSEKITEIEKEKIINNIPQKFISNDKIQTTTKPYVEYSILNEPIIRTIHPNAGSLINVANHLISPNISICKIITDESSGTGFLVGPNLLLTAAHCFMDREGNVLSGWTCYPAYNNGAYNNYSSGWQEAIFGEWVYNGSSSGDWCVIELDWNMGNEVGWIYCQSYGTNSEMLNTIVHSVGYPGETQQYSPGNISFVYNGAFEMTAIPVLVMSGGPILRWSDDMAIGINHARYDGDVSYGVGCRINQDIINIILSRS